MKCPTCGNPVPRETVVCPYCESPLSREARPKPELVRTINVKQEDVPAENAADRMETMVGNAKAAGSKVVILIHGYGSAGLGGATRNAVRHRLARLLSERRVRTVIFGEDFGPSSSEAIRLASDHPVLLAPHVFGAQNEGVTIVGL